MAHNFLYLEDDGGVLTEQGRQLFSRLAIELDALPNRRKSRAATAVCRPCLDWSERWPHIAGAVGVAMCRTSFDNAWVRRIEGTRAVVLTPKDRSVFKRELGIAL
jgi:hypothetical protein